VLVQLEPSEEFLVQRALLTLRLRKEAAPILEALRVALDKLQETGWGRELDIRQIGGNRFAYIFHEQYEVTFTIRDQRPSVGPTEEMRLQLLTIPLRG